MHKVLHMADLHLGCEHRYLGERAGKHAEEALQTLERVVEWVLDDAHDIAAVLIAGDLFETHDDPDPRLTGRVITTLRKITASGRVLVTVPGNHDEYSYPESVYRAHAESWPGVLVTNPHLEEVARLDLGGVDCAVYSLAYIAGLSPRTLPSLKEDPGAPQAGALRTDGRPEATTRIAVLHGTLDADPTDRSYRIDSQTLIESGFTYAALGHIHRPSETQLGDGLAVYPGSLNGKGFDDPGVGELVVLSFPGGRPSVERVPFPVRSIQTQAVDLARYETQESLIEDLERSARSNLILRLDLSGPRPRDFDLEHLLGRLRGLYFHLEANDRSVVISEDEVEHLAHQPTIKGLFTRLVCEKIAEANADQSLVEQSRLALKKGLAAFETAQRGR